MDFVPVLRAKCLQLRLHNGMVYEGIEHVLYIHPSRMHSHFIVTVKLYALSACQRALVDGDDDDNVETLPQSNYF